MTKRGQETTMLRLSFYFKIPQNTTGGTIIGVVPRGLKSLQGDKKNLLKKSLLWEGQSFLNILTTSQKYSIGTTYDATRLSRDLPKKRSLSQLKSNRDRLRLQTTLYVKGVR